MMDIRLTPDEIAASDAALEWAGSQTWHRTDTAKRNAANAARIKARRKAAFTKARQNQLERRKANIKPE